MGGGKSYTDSPQGIISAEHYGRARIFRLTGKWRELCSTAVIIVGITNMLRDNRINLCCMCVCVCAFIQRAGELDGNSATRNKIVGF